MTIKSIKSHNCTNEFRFMAHFNEWFLLSVICLLWYYLKIARFGLFVSNPNFRTDKVLRVGIGQWVECVPAVDLFLIGKV